MNLDDARKKTDEELKQMERKLAEIYSQAKSEITEKWDTYMEQSSKEIAPLQKAYDDAKKSGDKDLIKKTGKALGQAKREQTWQNDYYKDMISTTTKRLAHTNETALAYINDQMPGLYAINYNQAKETADQIGISFSLVDESTVKRLVRDGDIKLPKKKMNIPKDQRWNTKQLNSSVLQGILQGESMDKIADRILPIVDNNRKAAIRNARTMVTGAENLGRLDSYKQMQEDGIVMNKVWMATPDGRTRDWHVDMDGQEVGIDDEFIDGLGNELMYPGDPGGAPETIYNCRCTMVTNVIGFRREDGSISLIDYDAEGETLHERQMAEEKERRAFKVEDKQESKTETIVYEGAEVWNKMIENNDLGKMDEWTDDWLDKITQDEREGVRTYTGSAYNNMNKFLRGLTKENKYPEVIKNCTEALNKASLPERTIVTRGSSYRTFELLFGDKGEEMIAQIEAGDYKNVIGMMISDKGFMSTTPDFSGGVGGEIRYVIDVPEGANAMYIANISAVRSELELLIQRDSQFIIQEITEGWDSEIVVYMSML